MFDDKTEDSKLIFLWVECQHVKSAIGIKDTVRWLQYNHGISLMLRPENEKSKIYIKINKTYNPHPPRTEKVALNFDVLFTYSLVLIVPFLFALPP